MLKRILLDRRGAVAAEYVLILSIVGAAIAVSALALGNDITGSIEATSDNIETCGGSC